MCICVYGIWYITFREPGLRAQTPFYVIILIPGGRKDGRTDGRKDGRTKGSKEARKQGRKEEIEEGNQEGRKTGR
jgi:hypothetical protein